MGMIAVDEALERVLAAAGRLESEWVAITEAGGRVLAADLVARRTQPPADLSAMDGYAVIAASTPAGAPLRVVGESIAGRGFSGRLSDGEAVRIFTGAPLPDGADAVIIQESAARDGDTVRFARPVTAGTFVRRRGIDFAEEETVLEAGTVLTPPRVGLAAAMNYARLEVAKKPTVAVLSTGSELVPPGGEVPEGAIVASNGLIIAELIRREGAIVRDHGLVRDDPAAIAARLRAALAEEPDVLCLSGGASVGDYDFSRSVLADEGIELDFWRIAMRPGKPMAFGRRGRTAVFALPGNPVSSFVTGRLFLVPFVRALEGRTDARWTTILARLAAPLGANDVRRDFLRTRLDERDGLVATPLPRQDSSLLTILAAADGLIVRPENAPPAAAGEQVDVIRL